MSTLKSVHAKSGADKGSLHEKSGTDRDKLAAKSGENKDRLRAKSDIDKDNLHEKFRQAHKAYSDLDEHAKRQEAKNRELQEELDRLKSRQKYEDFEPVRRSVKRESQEYEPRSADYEDDKRISKRSSDYEDGKRISKRSADYEDGKRISKREGAEKRFASRELDSARPKAARSLSPNRDTISSRNARVEQVDRGGYEEVCAKLGKALEAKKATEKLNSTLQSQVKDLTHKHEKYKELKAKHEKALKDHADKHKKLVDDYNALKMEHARAKRDAKDTDQFKTEASTAKKDCEKLAFIAANSVEQSKKYEDALRQVGQILSVYQNVIKQSDPKLAEHLQETREGIAKQLKQVK